MRKPLLVTALVAMQLLSWGGNALYLCLCDGSACLDFGPDNCHCCPPAHEGAGEARHHEICRSHVSHLAELESAEDPCDCTHVQISPVSGPMIVHDSSKGKVPSTAPVLISPVAYTLAQPRAVPSERGKSPPPAAGHSLTALSVMLRC
jgi:hypothetical protein